MMVAGVFLRFGLDLVHSLHADLAIAGPMVVTWLVLSAFPLIGRRMPPLIGALLIGAAMIVALNRIDPSTLNALELAGIGAAFWGLIAGFTVSWLMERANFAGLQR